MQELIWLSNHTLDSDQRTANRELRSSCSTLEYLTGRIGRPNELRIGRDHAGVVLLAAESKAGSGIIKGSLGLWAFDHSGTRWLDKALDWVRWLVE